MSEGNGPRVESCERLIRAFLLRHPLGPDAAEIDDYIQEAKIRLWQVLENGREIEFLSAYIRKIVDSIVINHLQKSIRERTLLASADWALSESRRPRPRESDRRGALIEEVRAGLASLGGPRRTVLQMTLAGFSIREIAATRKWTPKKTYHLYERGLRELKRICRGRGGRS